MTTPSRRSGRRSIGPRALALAGSLLALVALGAGDASKGKLYEGPGLDHTEYVSVVPSSGLHVGERVEVSGFGFRPKLTLAFNMCTLVVRGYNDCDPNTTKLPSAYSSATGTFGPDPYVVTQVLHIPAQRNALLVCAHENCSLGVGDPSGLTAGSHCVSFTPAPCTPAGPDRFVSAPGQGGGSGGGSSAGVVVGAVVAAVVVLGLAALFLVRRRRTTAGGATGT